MNTLNIIFVGDAGYFDKSYPVMVNILEVHQELNIAIEFYVMTRLLSDQQKMHMDEIIAHYPDAHWHYIEMPEESLSDFGALRKGKLRWGKEAAYWMLVGKYLPDSVDKAIFMDLDVLVLGDLMPLFDWEQADDELITYFFNRAWQSPLIAQKMRGEEVDKGIRRSGLIGNSGFLLLNVAGFRQVGIDEAYLKPYIQELSQMADFDLMGSRMQVFGDQGFAQYALDRYAKVVYTDLISHGYGGEPRAVLGKQLRFIHFTGNGPKIDKMRVNEALGSASFELFERYHGYKLLAQTYIGDPMVIQDLSDVTTYIRQLQNQPNDFVGFYPKVGVDGYTFRRSKLADKTYFMAFKHPYKRMMLWFSGDKAPHQAYRLKMRLSFNYSNKDQQDPAIRLIADNVPKRKHQVLTRLRFDEDEIIELDMVVSLNDHYHGIGMTTSDFPMPIQNKWWPKITIYSASFTPEDE